MLGFARADDAALVSFLGDPQRTVAAYRSLLRRGRPALSAIRAGLRDADPAVREGCCRLLDHLVDTESMGELIAMAAELVGKFTHSDARATAALQTSHAGDPSPAVRKKAGWFVPGGAIYERAARRV
ncbi:MULTISPECIES: hypothetical protein [unclassified Streptomyces]|uniref:hypothetical protein n=1 Tax=unclassified Streptomyces TaxID=2593676 RepID=UPI00036A2018|nr:MULTISPECIES: hypothetical protein [unclassified Streptomyces]MYT33063.1 hypothetical protein [Streptomyces sp. SID8354]